MTDYKDEAFITLQRLLPQHALSRLLGKVASSTSPALKKLLIRKAIKHYKIDLTDAESANIDEYSSFNHFFTRALKPQARPVDTSVNGIVSPADGAISQLGAIKDGEIFQAKNHYFSTQSLLGLSPEYVDRFSQGSFFTVYLSPRDYHRVHCPVEGTLLETRYIPGKLFSVNRTTAQHVPGLFARNERLVCLFDTPSGLMTVVMVGAIFVAGIRTVWHGDYAPKQWHECSFDKPQVFSAGDELGQFSFGSTVIVTSEKPVAFLAELNEGTVVKMGQKMGTLPVAS